ncbi:hypothetical protein CYMTET_25115 [Cymbomonas tetramitiformis]|uniref:Uncharacterized protein n=1 Tax=Cymbomonas tetramitiformis TaxID=36881 RepID=A0AAE0FUF0_9CHLO|nr:hypothetical protein CYMTET_25115 [Cymbomonas tetramitiformis]
MRRDCHRYIRQLHSEFGEVANLLKRRASPVDDHRASSNPTPTSPAAALPVQSVTPPSGHAAADSASTLSAASASAPAAATTSDSHREGTAKKLPPRSALAFEDVTIPGVTTSMTTRSADSKSGDPRDRAATASPATAERGPPRGEAVSAAGMQTVAGRPQAAEEEASLPEGETESSPRDTPAAAIDPLDDAATLHPSTEGASQSSCNLRRDPT